MHLEILADGTISVRTDKIAAEHHLSADALLDFITDKAGGQRHTTQRRPGHVHRHAAQPVRHREGGP
jgi:hypothetical protein